MADKKPVHIQCRAEMRDGTKGCGGSQAVITLDLKQKPQTPQGIAGQGASQAFGNMLSGRTLRYKCCSCNGIFTITQ